MTTVTLRRGARASGQAGATWTTRIIWASSALILAFLVLVPIGYLLAESLKSADSVVALNKYLEVLGKPRVQSAILNTFLISTGAAILAVIVGVPLAFIVGRTDVYAKNFVRASILISLVSPPFLLAIAYIVLLGPNAGWINVGIRELLGIKATSGPLDIFSVLGFLLLAVPHGVAFVFIQTTPAFESMDGALEEAARTTGASMRRTILRVTMPLARPAILAGGLLAFSTSLALYGTAYLLGIDYITIAIREELFMGRDFAAAAVLAAVMVVMSMLALFLYRRAVRSSSRYLTVAGKGHRTRRMRLGRGRIPVSLLGVLYAFIVLIVPFTVLILTSLVDVYGLGPQPGNFTLDNYAWVLGSPRVAVAIRTSAVLALITATIVIALSIVVAYLITRTQLRVRGVLDYLSILPLGIAGTAFAVGLIIAYLSSPLDALDLYGTMWLLLIAYVTRFIPYGVRMAQTSLIQIAPELEEAARVSGSSWARSMRRVTVPLMKNGLVYGWALVFIQTLPELGASAMLVGPGTNVVSTTILDIWDNVKGIQRASALSALVFLLILVLVLVARQLTGRSPMTEERR